MAVQGVLAGNPRALWGGVAESAGRQHQGPGSGCRAVDTIRVRLSAFISCIGGRGGAERAVPRGEPVGLEESGTAEKGLYVVYALRSTLYGR